MLEEARIPRRPALAGWCRVVEDGSRLLLEHGGTLVTLEGRAVRALLPRLLPLLDGSRTLDEVVRVLGQAAAPAVEGAVSLLAEQGLLVDGPPGEPDDGRTPLTAAASYAAAVTRRTTVGAAAEALREAGVVVLGSGVAAEAAACQLEQTGFLQVERRPIHGVAAPEALAVAVPGPDELRGLAAVNDRRLDDGGAWIQVLPYDGRHLVVGPLFLPGATACRSCYVTRRGACSGYEDDFGLVDALPPRAVVPPALAVAAGAFAAVLALRWCTVRDPSLPGCFYALEAGPILRLSHHRLLRVPRCGACGAQRAVPSPWHQAPVG